MCVIHLLMTDILTVVTQSSFRQTHDYVSPDDVPLSVDGIISSSHLHMIIIHGTLESCDITGVSLHLHIITVFRLMASSVIFVPFPPPLSSFQLFRRMKGILSEVLGNSSLFQSLKISNISFIF